MARPFRIEFRAAVHNAGPLGAGLGLSLFPFLPFSRIHRRHVDATPTNPIFQNQPEHEGIVIATRIGKHLAFLLLPLIGITSWFMYDGGIDFGWNLVWYWIWIIGFLLVHQAALLLKLVFTHKRVGFSRENRVFMLIGFILLLMSGIFFMLQLN